MSRGNCNRLIQETNYSKLQVLFTDQEIISAKNAIDTHAQDLVVNDELLLPILKAIAQCTRSLYATRYA
jgi:hypothetical protein